LEGNKEEEEDSPRVPRLPTFHTIGYGPSIQSQLATRSELKELMQYKFGHVTPRILGEQNLRNPPSGGRLQWCQPVSDKAPQHQEIDMPEVG